MKLEQDVCNGSKRKQIYKCDWLWQTGYYAKTKRKGGRGMRKGWEYKKLGDLCDIYQPKTLATEQLVADGKYYVYGANGIIGRYNDYNHEQSEILLTCRGATCGTINISQPYSWINGNAMVIHRKSEDLSFDFLKYLMLSLDYSLIITGAAQPQITRQKIAPIIVKFPSLSVQQYIVSELDKINELIRLKKEQLKDYDNLAQSIFYEMFGDPVVNEKGWEVKKFADLYKLKSGDSLSTKNFVEGEIPVYGGNGISGYHNDFNMDGDFIIIGRVGVYCGNVREVHGKFWLTDNAFQLFYNREIQYPCFIHYLLEILDLHKYANAAAQPVISNLTLKDVEIIIPPLSLQQLFAQRIELIEKQKEEVQRTIKDLETLLASRMQYWFD